MYLTESIHSNSSGCSIAHSNGSTTMHYFTYLINPLTPTVAMWLQL